MSKKLNLLIVVLTFLCLTFSLCSAESQWEAIKEAGENYTSFTKTSDGMDGNVKFIIKTDAVK